MSDVPVPAPRATRRPPARRTNGSGSAPPKVSAERKAQIVAAALFVLCCGLLGAAAGGAFTVRQVVVVGSNLPETAIVATADVTGQNIFRVRSDVVVRRVAGIRQIAVDRVDTEFPDRVVIYARRRIPFVAWKDGPVLYLLDRDGRVITNTSSTTLPVIVGTAPRTSLGPGVVAAVRYAMDTLPGAPKGAIAGFKLDPTHGLTIVAQAGWVAYLGNGTPQALVDRIATLATALRSPKAQAGQIQYVDLRHKSDYFHFAPTP